MKTETWCGHEIRFIEKDGDWWAVLKDVCDALDLKAKEVGRQLQEEYKEDDKTTLKGEVGTTHLTKSDKKKSKKDYRDEILAQTLDGEPVLAKTLFADTLGRLQPTLIVTELGLYDVIFQSRKKEAREFKQWVFKIIRELRKASGLESYETFRMMDKEIQKSWMAHIKDQVDPNDSRPYMLANHYANLTVAHQHDAPKTIKKADMNREMLEDRQPILEDATLLVVMKEKFGLDYNIQEALYHRYPKKDVLYDPS